ncbi:UDP-N-acetylmuramoyl-tripeptide--D-alanyl-D-alanine ligase [Actinomyces minihominis]|uniref:UDP-N-acetylmuramoyl-tripeptide--D-alanyl-D- alanine ligase n=1 Tax=Actinomyces minihominis TaxID=2002838 RepID=UPI000C08B2D7|nr:UDP-N-acetylmuramoyl-tripeptide--D-alanyl-D-alanine ligase [Actinomyces minihominis]
MLRSLEWVAGAVSGVVHLPEMNGNPATILVDIAKATTDSRECEQGSIYFARFGEEADGHSFIPQAIAAGAELVVGERLIEDISVPQIIVENATVSLGGLAHRHLEDLRDLGPIQVIGVTGSAGKTTVKDLLAGMFARSGPTVAPVLSFNNEVGCPLTILKAAPETRFLVLEMGASGPGHIRYLTDIAPLDAAIELMVGRAHLGGYDSVDSLVETKRELVEGLRTHGVAVLNADDEAVAAMSSHAPGEVIYFSASGREDAPVRATHVLLEEDGCPSFVLEAPDFRGRVKLRLAGLHQVGNALAAVAGHYALGCSTIQAVRSLEESTPVSPHRMAITEDVLVEAAHGRSVTVTVIDDSYNANPDSMRASFEAANSIRRGRRLVMVLGEMLELGEGSDEIHREVGLALAEAEPDVVVTIGAGASPLLESLSSGVTTYSTSEVDLALEAVLGELQTADVVLLKGSNGSGAWRVAEALLGKA